MLNSFLTKLLRTLLVMFGVSSLVFFLIHWVPGDPVEAMLGEFASNADREALRQTLGLNRPIFEQWLSYLIGIIQGDLGTSLYSHRPVLDLLLERLPATLELAFAGMVVAIMLGFPAGIIAALNYQKSTDRLLMAGANLGLAFPNFVLGPVLVLILSVQLGWFPVSGRAGPMSIVLPAITLGSAMAGILARMLRASLLEVLAEDYIRTAFAKGISKPKIILVHALSNAMLPIITLLALQLGALLAGTVITEKVFAWPGIGGLLLDAIERRDYPVLQACVLLVSLSYVIVNLISEMCYQLIDPRLRDSKQ